uniref:Uncharacterized protein n=1 Tax=Arundo donax TaxID=35708 RepID=A0A0A9CNP4_ARUDO
MYHNTIIFHIVRHLLPYKQKGKKKRTICAKLQRLEHMRRIFVMNVLAGTMSCGLDIQEFCFGLCVCGSFANFLCYNTLIAILRQDPVCGSAHCVLAPYWGADLGKQKLTAFQASPRSGILYLELEAAARRVQIQVEAVTVMTGTLLT